MRVRILYSHRIQSRDGQSVHVEELVAALRGDGHEVMVVGPSFYEDAGFGGESSTVARLRRLLPGVAGELAELAYNVPAYRRLAAACRAFKPDLIYERCNLLFMAGTWLARRTGLPLFLEVNSPLAEERFEAREPAFAGARAAAGAGDLVRGDQGVAGDGRPGGDAGRGRGGAGADRGGAERGGAGSVCGRGRRPGVCRWCWVSWASCGTGMGWMR